MRPNLKLNGIEQEHLQELYDAAGIGRDELPYSQQFEKLCQDFQDRTFKNADPEQVYGALLKYVRSSTCASGKAEVPRLQPDDVKQLRLVLKKHGRAGKVLPYSYEFEASLKEFNGATGKELSARQFWMSIARAQSRAGRGGSQTPPKPVQAAEEDPPEEEE